MKKIILLLSAFCFFGFVASAQVNYNAGNLKVNKKATFKGEATFQDAANFEDYIIAVSIILDGDTITSFVDFLNQNVVVPPSVWDTIAGGGAYYNGGNVGIDTATPEFTLDINGDVGIRNLPLLSSDTMLVMKDDSIGYAIAPASGGGVEMRAGIININDNSDITVSFSTPVSSFFYSFSFTVFDVSDTFVTAGSPHGLEFYISSKTVDGFVLRSVSASGVSYKLHWIIVVH